MLVAVFVFVVLFMFFFFLVVLVILVVGPVNHLGHPELDCQGGNHPFGGNIVSVALSIQLLGTPWSNVFKLTYAASEKGSGTQLCFFCNGRIDFLHYMVLW